MMQTADADIDGAEMNADGVQTVYVRIPCTDDVRTDDVRTQGACCVLSDAA
jgi:hypothetical protein